MMTLATHSDDTYTAVEAAESTATAASAAVMALTGASGCSFLGSSGFVETVGSRYLPSRADLIAALMTARRL
ncbi:hypothetical protein PsorP6_000981 [Peronosclerospora sorghi]|uniref:Uncharacterized protein n=1 Tax=Peronosclerospora sorghi TaxID=230839 RepID=A0ACC0WPE0_9STRA|nr:hypothetical protein PsorP6_000981 [Peronosclerospora sorghi]